MLQRYSRRDAQLLLAYLAEKSRHGVDDHRELDPALRTAGDAPTSQRKGENLTGFQWAK
jgi:hypothetical protein